MSLHEDLHNIITENIRKFISSLCERYSLDEKEVSSMWFSESELTNVAKKGKTTKKAPSLVSSLADVDMSDLSAERLSKSTVAELKALCKQKGCKCTGKKDELISRLLGQGNGGEEKVEKKANAKTTATANAKPAKKSPAKKGKDVVEKIVKKISKTQVINIRQNAHGNIEHPQTGLVFDKSKRVIGKQQDDGTVTDLDDNDIENCKKYKFPYNTPKNLDGGISTKDAKIRELEDEEIIDKFGEDPDGDAEKQAQGTDEILDDDGEEEIQEDEEEIIED